MEPSKEYPRTRWLVFIASAIALMAGNMFNLSFAAILPEIAQGLGIDIVTANAFMWVFMLAVSFSVIAGGFLCDRFGVLLVILMAALLSASGALMMPWAGNGFTTTLVARILEGIGTGFAFSLLSPIMTIWFPPKERGLVAGLFGSFIAMSGAIGFPLCSALFKAIGSWQQMSAWISIIGWAAFLLTIFLMTLPKPTLPAHAHEAKAEKGDGFAKTLTDPLLYVCTIVSFFSAWLLQTLILNTPAYMSADSPLGLGFGYMTASNLMIFFSIAMMLAPIISGIIQDKVFKQNARPFIFIGFALCCVFMYLLLVPAVFENRAILITCLVFAGSGIAVLAATIPLFVGLNFPVQTLGKVYGIIAGLGNFGGATGLFVTSWAVGAKGTYSFAITIISVAALIGFLLVFAMKRREVTPT
jgi:MFS family permease